MTFTSLTFILFLPIVFALYWGLRNRRAQNIVVVAASFLFYGWWDYRFCSLMLITALIDFATGWGIDRLKHQGWRRTLLGISVVSNLAILGFFKYFNFFVESFSAAAETVGWQLNPGTLEIILPVGISFYTFQTLSYTIDVYRREMRASTSLIDYLAFVSFFPQLVAGPIERATNLLPQFSKAREFRYHEAVEGCRQILWGFFKKLAIADVLATFVNSCYAQPDAFRGPELMLATVCFAFQIYCDFSAYSDIAVGTGKLFGVSLMRNFAYPYFSQSITEFWRRWHISLSTWFRDYVYLPLGGSRVSRVQAGINIGLTFLLSGLWHGANWTFVTWGGINGAAAVAERRLTSDKSRDHCDVPGGEGLLPKPRVLLRMLATFALVCLCWVFFRAQSMSEALLILQRMFTDIVSIDAFGELLAHMRADRSLRKILIVLTVFVLVEWFHRRLHHPLGNIQRLPLVIRWPAYTLLLWGTFELMPDTGGRDFIYFAF